MMMYVYAQKPAGNGNLIAGWITSPFPRDISQLKLDFDMNNALRFDVDNNFNLMNELLENGWSLMTAGNKFNAVQAPSAAPFSFLI